MLDIANETYLAIDVIRTDGGTQPRAELNQEVIQDYAQQMRDGAVFPPVIVFYDGSAYWLADGFHRYHAAKLNENTVVDTDIRQGTLRDAVLHSFEANIKHGLSLALSDRKRGATKLLQDAEWSGWSDREIGRRCGLDHKTIGKLRQDITGEIPQLENRTYITKHGTIATMNTSNIGQHTPESQNTFKIFPDFQQWQEDNLSLGLDGLGDVPPEAVPFTEDPNEEDEIEEVEPRYDQNKHVAYCKYCYSTHDNWSLGLGDYDGTVWECGKCDHTTRDEFMQLYTLKDEEPGEEQKDFYNTYSDIPSIQSETKPAPVYVAPVNSAGVPVAVPHILSRNNEWYTPAKYIEAARELMGSIDLDPASCEAANEIVKVTLYYDKETNGLDKPWSGRVWLNPPYGRDDGGSNQEVWSRRLIEQYQAGITTEAILLVNAAVDTKWFQRLFDYPICFPNHRINFTTPEPTTSGSTHGSALIYFGPNYQGFYQIFSQFGVIVQRCQGW